MPISVTNKTRAVNNGDALDAVPVEANFTELYNNDTTLATQVNTNTANIASTLSAINANNPRYIYGLAPVYASSNTITIGYTSARDSGNATQLTITSSRTVDLSFAGVNGRASDDTDSANTWFYLYIIAKSDGTSPCYFLSTKNVAGGGTLSGLPSGYSSPLYRQMPLAIRNNASSNITPFLVGEGWPNRPVVTYDVNTTDFSGAKNNNIVNAGVASSFATINASSFIPPISKKGLFLCSTGGSGGSVGLITTTGSSHNGIAFGGSSNVLGQYVPLGTNASQQISYMRQTGTGTIFIDVIGYVVTEL